MKRLTYALCGLLPALILDVIAGGRNSPAFKTDWTFSLSWLPVITAGVVLVAVMFGVATHGRREAAG